MTTDLGLKRLEVEISKTKKWRNINCGVNLNTMRFVPGGIQKFLVPTHNLPVPGIKSWMGTTETFLVYKNIILLHRPSSKGTKLLLQVIKATIKDRMSARVGTSPACAQHTWRMRATPSTNTCLLKKKPEGEPAPVEDPLTILSHILYGNGPEPANEPFDPAIRQNHMGPPGQILTSLDSSGSVGWSGRL